MLVPDLVIGQFKNQLARELTASPLCAALCQIAADAVSPPILDLKGNALMLFFL